MKIFYPYSEILPSQKARALQVVNTVHSLAKAGAEVELYAGLRDSGEKILKTYGLNPHPNLRFVPAPILRDFNLLGLKVSCGGIFQKGCLRYLKEKKGRDSFIYTRHLRTAFFLLKKFPGIPLIYEAHEIFSLKKHTLFSEEKFIFDHAKGVVFISRSLFEKTKEFFSPKGSVSIIPDGVNPEIIEQAKKKRIDGDAVYVGQLYPWKGAKCLVSAMVYIPDVRLAIVGGGDEKEKKDIERIIKRLGLSDRVRLTGFLPYPEALRYMTGAKVLVLPLKDEPISRYFTSPLKLFEYMASSVPIVASDLPTIREILSDESCLFVPPSDIKGLACAIEKLIKDKSLSQKLADNAYLVSQQYSWTKRAEKIINFLNNSK